MKRTILCLVFILLCMMGCSTTPKGEKTVYSANNNALQATDPIIGSWKLVSPVPTNTTDTFREVEGDMMEFSSTTILRDGSSHSIKSMWPKGGGILQDLSGTFPEDDLYVEVLDVSGQWYRYVFKDGRQVAIFQKIVSEDGNTLTMTFKTTNPDGKEINGKAIYEKVDKENLSRGEINNISKKHSTLTNASDIKATLKNDVNVIKGINTNINSASLSMASRNLTPEKVTELEAIVEEDPDDIRSQTLLISYYFRKKNNDESIRSKWEKNIMWLIENHPETEVLGRPDGQLRFSRTVPHNKLVELWKEQLRKYPDNPQVILNAGNFFLIGDVDLAIECYKLGKSLDSENSTVWDRKLGQAYSFKMRRSSEQNKQILAQESYRYYENAYKNAKSKPSLPNFEKIFSLPRLAKAALAAGELDKATAYANEMLSSELHEGEYVYNGNYILGMIAIQNGDIQSAGEYLLTAGDSTGSPVLNSFGPNMSLAKALLDHGERDIILAFLKKCLKFWNGDTSPCSRWIREMEEGKTPDFRQNLNY